MKVKSISKFRSAVLVLAMLTFTTIAVIGGVAVGGEQSNVEQPVLGISKTMISGETTVPTNTKQYWDLEIVVTYDDLTDLNGVVVSDTIPKEITLDSIAVSNGVVATNGKGGSTKLTWTIGTMSPGDTETLTMSISTKTISGGRRRGMTVQYFMKPGEYSLNEGASVSGTHQTGTITAGPTDPITVYAEEGGRTGGGGGGGGGGGRWR